MPFWNVTSTTLENGVTYVGGTSAYKDDNGKNKLTTITANNTTGYVPVVPGATATIRDNPPGLKGLSYAVQTDGKITYQYTDPSGGTRQFNSIQDLANAQIAGYNANTTLLIKNGMQSNLKQLAENANVGPSTATTQGQPGADSNPQNGSTSTPNTGDPNNQGNAANTDIGSRINNYNSRFAEKDKTLIYPINRKNANGGDFIKFEILSYQKSGLGNSATAARGQVTLPGMEYRTRNLLGSIYLPIQSGIVEGMSVDWGGGELNPITAAFANSAYNIIGSAAEGDLGKFFGSFSGSAAELQQLYKSATPELKLMLQNYFVEQAVKTNGLLSRTVGGAINNNLELLFNGPMLRSFTFSFKLTPREQREALVIRDIIRWFKKSMAPSLSNSQLFLLAPNVFKISYVYTGDGSQNNGNHPYLNRIKVAALRDIAVNYTPDGNYMTYQDGSMTQYELNLTFGEIDPVYENDYEFDEGLVGTGW